jgi:hypothetical protein
MLDVRLKTHLAVAEVSELLRTVAVPVKIYDGNTLQAEMMTAENKSLSVFAEKSLGGNWMFSLWISIPSREGLCSVDRQILSIFHKEYTLLFSACVKALTQITQDPELLSKLRVNSYDALIERNFLQGWNGDITDNTIRVEVIDQRCQSDTVSLLSRWLSNLPWAKPVVSSQG